MRQLNIRLRSFLITVVLGLASVLSFNSLVNKSNEIPVKLPQTNSESPIIISPKYKKEMHADGGGA